MFQIVKKIPFLNIGPNLSNSEISDPTLNVVVTEKLSLLNAILLCMPKSTLIINNHIDISNYGMYYI